MATISEIYQMLAAGQAVSLKRRYVGAVLEGLAAHVAGTQQYRVTPKPNGMSEIVLERDRC